MATSGSVDSGGYQGRVLRFEWGTNSISAERNVRNIWYKVTAVEEVHRDITITTKQ